MTSDAILKTISHSPFAACLGEIPRHATLQFLCPDQEIKRQQLVYRQLGVKNFRLKKALGEVRHSALATR